MTVEGTGGESRREVSDGLDDLASEMGRVGVDPGDMVVTVEREPAQNRD